jgi:hypothetical protein
MMILSWIKQLVRLPGRLLKFVIGNQSATQRTLVSRGFITLPVAGLDEPQALPILFGLREAASTDEVGLIPSNSF